MNKDLMWMTLLAPLALAAKDVFADPQPAVGAIQLAAGAAPLNAESIGSSATSGPAGTTGSAQTGQATGSAGPGVAQPSSGTGGAPSRGEGSGMALAPGTNLGRLVPIRLRLPSLDISNVGPGDEPSEDASGAAVP